MRRISSVVYFSYRHIKTLYTWAPCRYQIHVLVNYHPMQIVLWTLALILVYLD